MLKKPSPEARDFVSSVPVFFVVAKIPLLSCSPTASSPTSTSGPCVHQAQALCFSCFTGLPLPINNFWLSGFNRRRHQRAHGRPHPVVHARNSHARQTQHAITDDHHFSHSLLLPTTSTLHKPHTLPRFSRRPKEQKRDNTTQQKNVTTTKQNTTTQNPQQGPSTPWRPRRPTLPPQAAPPWST